MFASLTNSNQPTKHLLLNITYIKTRLLPKVVEFFYLNIPTSSSNIAVFLYILLILFGYVQKQPYLCTDFEQNTENYEKDSYDYCLCNDGYLSHFRTKS